MKREGILSNIILDNESDISSNNESVNRLKILFHVRAFLELYKVLSKKLGYFNKEYDKRINRIIEKLEKCLQGKKCIKENFNVKDIVKEWDEITENFIENKIDVEISKVSFEEGIPYIGVDIWKFEKLELEGKQHKITILSEEVKLYL